MEMENESRLRRLYRKNEVDRNKSYCYATDERNQTGSASILVWRAKTTEDGTVEMGNTEEKVNLIP